MKIEKAKGLIIPESIVVIITLIILLGGGSYVCFGFRERNQLKEEQRNQIVAILGAIKETVVITPIKASWGLGSEYYSEVTWSFHKPEDLYSQPPHTAKVVNGQIVELDGGPIKEMLGPRLTGPSR